MRKVVLTLLILTVVSPCIAKYSGGSGTEADPYQIADANDLLALAENTGDYGSHFILTADIDLDPNLPGNSVFTTAVIAPDTSASFGYQGTTFTGVFDGAGHTISNMTIDTSGSGNDYLGLFGYVQGGEIKNIGLENVSITGGNGSQYLGGLVGRNDYYNSSINNCYSTGAVTGGDYLGGLVGCNYYGSISNCYSTGAVTGGDNSEYLGGLVGENDYGTISDCYSTGAVSGSSFSRYVGGLVGLNSGYYYGSISNCYSTGAVTGGYDSGALGGLAGYNNGTISNCYSTGAVTSGEESCYLGGLVGLNGGSISNCYSTGDVSGGGGLGGLAGYNGGTISNCYSTGAVTAGVGSKHIGGLVGENWGGISSCYFLNTSGPDNGLGTPLTDAQMKQQNSFVGWDFIKVWCIDNGVSYPQLKWSAKYSGGGSGDPNDPYQIAAAEDLLTLAAKVNDYNKCFILTADIDLGSSGTFTTAVIASNAGNTWGYFGGVAFAGVFDGAGHKIINLTIDANGARGGYLGLFGYVSSGGEIKNLGLETLSVTGGFNNFDLGGLVGYNDSNSAISNCYSTGAVTSGSSSFYLGGLVGQNVGNISNCYFLITSGPDNGYGEPLADEEMKQQSSFAGWDFVGETANGYYDFWRLCNEGLEYPKLSWQYLPGDIVCPDGVDIEDFSELCEQWLFAKIPADVAPPGGDGIVNFADFAIFANQWGVTNDIYTLLDFTGQWLKVGPPHYSADISPLPNGDGRVNAADFAVMANDWLTGF